MSRIVNSWPAFVKKTGIADNTATSILRVYCPNANVSIGIKLDLLGRLGTGTDVYESSRCAVGMVVAARKPGVAVVPAAATLVLAQIATTSGGGTLTLAYGVSSVTGGVTAENYFDIQVTLVKTGTITDLELDALVTIIDANENCRVEIV